MCWKEESFKGKEADLISSRIPFIMAERGGSQKSVFKHFSKRSGFFRRNILQKGRAQP